MISQYLLPRDKYQAAQKKYGPPPSMLTLNKGKRSIHYFGANHSLDPGNKQYKLLKSYWGQFLKETEGRSRIVLVEGGLRKIEQSEAEAIRFGSEGSLITLLSHKEKLEVRSPDISLRFLIANLPPIKRDIADLYWFLSNHIGYTQASTPKPSFKSWFTSWCKYSDQSIPGGFNSSLADLKDTYKKIVGEEFEEENNPGLLINPNNRDTPVNALAQELSDIRDSNIVNEIERLWNEGNSLFVVFGQGHLIIQEPALNKLVS